LGEVGKEHVAIAAEKFLESQHDTMPAIAAFSIDADRFLGEIAERRRRTRRRGADHVDLIVPISLAALLILWFQCDSAINEDRRNIAKVVCPSSCRCQLNKTFNPVAILNFRPHQDGGDSYG